MHHATSPTTGTSKKHLHKQSNPSQNNVNRSCWSRKRADISDGITTVDIAMEHLRRQRGKKKPGKSGKPALPRDVDQQVTRALMVSRAHLLDYREQVTREMRTRHEISQYSAITTEKLMDGLSPFYTIRGERLEEPVGTIGKIKTIFSLLWNSRDEETGEYRINTDELGWATMLLEDLVDELEKRVEGYQDHCRDLVLEFESRLESYSLVSRDLEKRVADGTLQEVRK